MKAKAETPLPAQLLGVGASEIVRVFFSVGGSVSLISALVIPFFAAPSQVMQFRLLSVGCVLIAAAFAVIGWRLRNASVDRAMLVGCWAALALVCTTGIGRSEGLLALENYFFCMLICMVMPVSGVRAGAVMAAFCAAWVVLLAYLEYAGLLPGAKAVLHAPLILRVLTLSLVLGTAFNGGLIVRRLLAMAVEAVQAPERRYRQLFDELPAGVVLQRDDRIVEANAAARALLDLAGTASADAISAAARALLQLTAPLASRAAGSRIDAVSVHTATTTGPRVLQLSAVRVQAEEGAETLSMFVDDTERHAAMLEAQRVHAHVRHLFDASPDFVLLTAGSILGPIRLANEGFLRALDLPASAVLGRSLEELGIWHDSAERDAVVDRDRAQHIESAVVSFSLGDDGSRTMQLSTNGFEFDGMRYVVTFARDITANEALRLEQHATLSHAALGIALTANGEFTRVNDAFARLFATTPEALGGHALTEMFVDARAAELLLHRAGTELGCGGEVDAEHALRRADGTTFWARLRARAVDSAHPVDGEVWLVDDVTARREMQQALASARDAAEDASRAKSAFLANTSHEIRTPLNGLIGLARLAMKPGLDAARRRRYLTQMLESAENLGEIMGGILDMSKIESGKLVLESIAFSPREVLATLIDDFGPRAAKQGLDFSLHIDAAVPALVTGDPLRLRQIVGNYVLNALKFTAAGSATIRVSLRGAGTLRIEVGDTGIGIEPAMLPRLFHAFTQVDASTTRRYGGTGLGLSICRELANLMAGAVGVESELGRGSTFWVELPLAAATHDASDNDGDRVASSTPWIKRWSGDVPDERGANRASASISVGALAGRRVLLADDNPVNRLIATHLLASWKLEVLEVADGAAAVAAVDAAAGSDHAIELVLMDLQMPHMDGLTASRELRRRYGADVLPIVALTAGEHAGERDDARASGMDAFLVKPIDERALEQTLVSLLGAAHPRA